MSRTRSNDTVQSTTHSGEGAVRAPEGQHQSGFASSASPAPGGGGIAGPGVPAGPGASGEQTSDGTARQTQADPPGATGGTGSRSSAGGGPGSTHPTDNANEGPGAQRSGMPHSTAPQTSQQQPQAGQPTIHHGRTDGQDAERDLQRIDTKAQAGRAPQQARSGHRWAETLVTVRRVDGDIPPGQQVEFPEQEFEALQKQGAIRALS